MGGEILFILFIFLILFGADKLPEIARSLGKGLNEIKKATDEVKDEITNSTSGLRNEMDNIRSDISGSVNDVRNRFDDVTTEVHETTANKPADSTKYHTSDIGADSGLSIYENIQKAEENPPHANDIKPKPGDKDQHFYAENI